MLCKKCGASVPDTTYECPFCQAKLGDEPPVEEETTPVEEAAAEAEDTVADNEEIFDENEQKRNEQIQRMLDEKQQQLSEIKDRREIKRKKQQRNKIILIAIICVLVSLLVGTGAYLISNSTNNNRDNVTISTPSPEPTVDPMATETPLPTLEPTVAPSPEVTATPEAGTSWQPVDAADTASSGATASSSTGAGSSGTGKTTSGTSKTNTKKSNTNKTSSSTKSTTKKNNATTSASTTKVVNTGITKQNLAGTVAKGGKVVLDSASGRYIMSFVSGKTEYFAYVSEGSTTAQIQNKTLGVTAVPTANTYKGSTVYEISNLTFFEGDVILKDSGTRLLTEADIAGMSKEQLGYARNEIFARHGRPFKTQKYKDYFAKCSWYKVNSAYNLADDKSNLNEIERANVDFIIAQENK